MTKMNKRSKCLLALNELINYNFAIITGAGFLCSFRLNQIKFDLVEKPLFICVKRINF